MNAALYDDERSGRPIDIDDREISRIVAMVCSDPPSGHYRWTLDLIVEETIKRNLIEKAKISREGIRIILKEHDLKPWREKMWCIGNVDDEYIKRMEDVLEVYERDYDPKRPVVCVDEKPVALMSDSRERKPLKPGSPAKVDYEYKRGGSANVFCAVEPKKGVYINKVTKKRKGPDFCQFLIDLDKKYKNADKIVLVVDNLSTHFKKPITDFLGKTEGERLWERFEIHYTPVHASWLNQAEIAIGMYSRQCLGDGRVGNIDYLRGQTEAWNKRINKKATIIQWRFSRSQARKSFAYDAGAKKLS